MICKPHRPSRTLPWLRSVVTLGIAVMGSATAANTRAAPPQTIGTIDLDAQFNAFLDRAYEAQLSLSPQRETSEGASKANYGKLDDYRPVAALRALRLRESQVREMDRRFPRDRLGPQARVSADLFRRDLVSAREAMRWRAHEYTFTAIRAPTTDIPSFLINNHQVTSVADARAYISRLTDIERAMGEIAADYRNHVAHGVIEPKLVFAPALASARRVVTGAPFDDGPDSALWADFKAKVAKLDTDAATRQQLLDQGSAALRGPARRGYDRIIAELEAASRKATGDGGVARLPNGKAFYAWTVRDSTTTDLTPQQVHAIGLSELAKVRAEMEAVARSLGGRGTLRDFLAQMRADPKFHYPNTDAGREQYLADARAVLADATQRAPRFFDPVPNAPLEVRRIEKWREATAPVAFYADGSPDGSRPGIFYVNLRDLSQVLKTSLTGIACHEGVPGHHFQSAYSNAARDLPLFRRRAGYGAWAEGWGLYSEQLCKEMGVYKDGYSLFSRLSGDARRAARLVADTGVNAMGWSREQALAFLKANTLLSEDDAESEVARYLTVPGQATSYMIGKRKIIELRERMAAAFGADFDIRQFHAIVLGSGALPLDMLEQQVDDAIAAHRASVLQAQPRR
ncbi:uncharacterized protein (DUF885 family) [Novosphingobium chloroacetimidivorans]|uniref:Uncharacterized protein (DUF885 family) n=1 Tax=Novosphingobium chloroacetimidivorans TaxID=1428314 RepID=A0A7W7K8M8_9SPHN|nr:DUF885 domain-containing protein [Novosphingobium chloroacetimidivorans]MBB4857956.1 uncharacterized protein (DUF885 family) [Novosphingobium chloroacetimidivorans]